ncbi:MAG: dienelactone hydrolase family protein [Micavibrio aeruginosavorus]|uniref:Dienelactone hydrolase family protein n=1 Tax=Micavibrio aeruginosavorus TaxID=349221 RepID=A0A7T5R3I0_9BACT|nr:MAG: dienelactone hydrolase family protein [Micavibrio aeruginosavorus]
MSLRAFCFFLLCLTATPALAGEPLLYKDGDVTLEGYFAHSSAPAPAPVVLIIHQWKGLGDYEKSRADMLAAQGYNAFAIDMYGQGVRPQTQEEAARQAGIYKNNPQLARQRVGAAIDLAKSMSSAGPQIAAIGYCFGGTMALEAARSGADLAAVVSFHGGLSTKAPAAAGAIAAPIMIHHGADDPFVPPAEVAGFEQEMTAAGAQITFYAYKGAVHSFTEKTAGNDPTKGAAYNEEADILSWQRSLSFLERHLKNRADMPENEEKPAPTPMTEPPAAESLTKTP